MNNTDRKLLIKYLGECNHQWLFTRLSSVDGMSVCQICGKMVWDGEKVINRRTFTTRDDMMDLYGAVVKAGKWDEFAQYCYEQHGEKGAPCWDDDAWLFCLSGEGYEDRCQMVAEWIKEASHE
ncbi:MAG: hypothetical protein PHV74_16055 [Dehalococcoidia bacterium]|nr:hypothetical protein [Dehalococcoidia bacterium]